MAARQAKADRRAVADVACDRDRTAGLVGEAIDLRQAETGALADRFSGEEGIEDLLEHVGAMPVPLSRIDSST